MVEINGKYYNLASIGSFKVDSHRLTITYKMTGGLEVAEIFSTESEMTDRIDMLNNL